MIPEIWQGHLNNGAKFANSIIRLLKNKRAQSIDV